MKYATIDFIFQLRASNPTVYIDFDAGFLKYIYTGFYLQWVYILRKGGQKIFSDSGLRSCTQPTFCFVPSRTSEMVHFNPALRYVFTFYGKQGAQNEKKSKKQNKSSRIFLILVLHIFTWKISVCEVLYQKSSETPDKIGKDLLALEGEKSLLNNREIKGRLKCQTHRALYILHISATSYSPLGRQIRLNGGQEPHSVNWILCFPVLPHISCCR